MVFQIEVSIGQVIKLYQTSQYFWCRIHVLELIFLYIIKNKTFEIGKRRLGISKTFMNASFHSTNPSNEVFLFIKTLNQTTHFQIEISFQFPKKLKKKKDSFMLFKTRFFPLSSLNFFLRNLKKKLTSKIWFPLMQRTYWLLKMAKVSDYENKIQVTSRCIFSLQLWKDNIAFYKMIKKNYNRNFYMNFLHIQI